MCAVASLAVAVAAAEATAATAVTAMAGAMADAMADATASAEDMVIARSEDRAETATRMERAVRMRMLPVSAHAHDHASAVALAPRPALIRNAVCLVLCVPGRADEADKWRRVSAPVQERRAEEMPGRSDNEDKWRPRGPPAAGGDRFGGDRSGPRAGGYGGDRDGPRSFGGDRDGGRDGGRSYGGDRFGGDRDGGRSFGGDRDGGRSYGGDRDGGRDGGRFGGDRDGGRSYGGDRREGGYGGDAGGDNRPAHLKALTKKGASSNDLAGDRASGASASPDAASPAPAGSSRFAKPPPEASPEDEDRPARGGDRDGGERRPYGGDRDAGRDGGERRPYGGDRDGGERRPYGGDRAGGDRDGGERKPYGGAGGSGGRFSDRDGGPSSGGSRWGDRDGGSSGGGGGYRGGRDGGYEPRAAAGGQSRYGGYGGAARTGGAGGDNFGPLPSGPRQDSYDEPRSALRKPAAAKDKDYLVAKPQAMEDRNVEIDESLTKKGVVSIAQRVSALEAAVEDNQTITADQLADSLGRIKIESIKAETASEFGNVLAKSLIDNKLTLAALISKLTAGKASASAASAASASSAQAPSLLLTTLVAFKGKKGDKALLELVNAAQKAEAGLDVCALLSGGLKAKDLDAFLNSRDLLILKPVPDLTAEVAASLAAGDKPEKILASIAAAVDPKLAPGLGVTNAVASHVFGLVFATAGKADLAVLAAWSPLLARVAPSFDADAQLRLLFEAQLAWFKAGATKALLKDTFVALFDAKLVGALVYDAWRNDLVEKSKNGKLKAMLQVQAWITDIQPKVLPSEQEQYGADEDLANEYGDGNDD